jgi:hypothetical protein
MRVRTGDRGSGFDIQIALTTHRAHQRSELSNGTNSHARSRHTGAY